jgi:uncharacterized membrane protein
MTGGWYKFLLVCHILAAIFGFGAVVLNGIYGAESKKRQGAEGLAITEANHRVSNVGEYFIYAVPIFGILMVLASHHVWKFSQTWVSAALALYVIALGVSHGVMFPAVKRIERLTRELIEMGPPPAGSAPAGPPPQVAELAALDKRLAIGGGFLNIMLVAIVVLMVWKPGV